MNRPLLLISLCQFQFAFKNEYIRKLRKDMLLNIARPCKFSCTIHIWHQTEQTICQLIKMYSFFFKRPMIAGCIYSVLKCELWSSLYLLFYSAFNILIRKMNIVFDFKFSASLHDIYEGLVTPITSSENINLKVMNGTFKWKTACKI